MLTITYCIGQQTLEESIDKIMRYDLGIDTREIHDFYIGVYTSGRWNHVYMSADSVSTFGQKDEIALGSLSKFITSCEIHSLIDEGKLNLTSTLDSILNIDDKDMTKISVGALLSHQSGLPLQINRYLIDASGRSNMDFSNSDLLRYLSVVDYDPTFTHFYNHTNHAILTLVRMQIEVELDTDYPFYGSEGMISNAYDLIPYINKCLSRRNEHPIYEVVNELTNLPHTYATYGLLAQEVKRNNHVFMMTGHTAESRAVVFIEPQTNSSVLILAPYAQDKYVDLGFLIMRLINDNWNKLKNGKKR